MIEIPQHLKIKLCSRRGHYVYKNPLIFFYAYLRLRNISQLNNFFIKFINNERPIYIEDINASCTTYKKKFKTLLEIDETGKNKFKDELINKMEAEFTKLYLKNKE